MSVKIIAEIGSNWHTLDDCMMSISQAKACGVDAVKFQLYSEVELYGFREGYYRIVEKNTGRVAYELPPEWLPKLKGKADAVGIEFMVTAFSPEGYDLVNQYVDTHKVASSEMCHVRILERLRSYGKPVILSTGAQHAEDISRAVAALEGVPVTLLYCVPEYPARSVDLIEMGILRDTFGLPVGYSDHTVDSIDIPRLAAELGATVIEKHVNFTEHTDTPDAPHSLNGEEFKRMVHVLRDTEARVRAPSYPSMILRHKRRLIAMRDISEGETLTEGTNFGIYRSLKDDTHAFPPFMVNEVEGRTAKRAIKAGDGVGPGDV